MHDRAPYKTVLTHGWTLDAQGKAMHKSAGNAVAPDEVIKESGAEILRLWCASSNYFDDMRCSAEILQRVTDGYRKLRNTARFALGNLHGFDPARDSVPDDEMQEIDRWALAELDAVIGKVRAAYEGLRVSHGLSHALQLLHRDAFGALLRHHQGSSLHVCAAQSGAPLGADRALSDRRALARMLAPILAFTADEIWENLPVEDERRRVGSSRVVSRRSSETDASLLSDWERLFEIREEVLRRWKKRE